MGRGTRGLGLLKCIRVYFYGEVEYDFVYEFGDLWSAVGSSIGLMQRAWVAYDLSGNVEEKALKAVHLTEQKSTSN